MQNSLVHPLKDLEKYPSVHLTSPHEWDPSISDYLHPDGNGQPSWTTDPNDRSLFDPNLNEFGSMLIEPYKILNILDDPPHTSSVHNLCANKHALTCTSTDYEKVRPYYGWVNTDDVKQTLGQTAQWDVEIDSFLMQKHLKIRNPALNVPMRHESVATDTTFYDTPTVDSGVKQAQGLWGETLKLLMPTL